MSAILAADEHAETPEPAPAARTTETRRWALALAAGAAARFREHGPDDVAASRKIAWAVRLGEAHGFADAVETCFKRNLGA